MLVEGEDEGGGGGGEECGDNLSLLISSSLEFLASALKYKNVRRLLFQQTDQQQQELSHQLVNSLIGYSQLTTETEAEWEADPNQMIADEDPESSSAFNCRVAAEDLLHALCHRFSVEFLRTLVRITQTVLTAQPPPASSWKPIEASLFLLGRLSGELIELGMERKQLVGFQPAAISQALMPLLTAAHPATVSPLLKGRFIWFMGRFANQLTAEMAATALALSVQFLQSSAEPAPVRILSAYAIQSFLRSLPFSNLHSQLTAIVAGVRDISLGASGDSLTLIMEVGLAIAQALGDDDSDADSVPAQLLQAAAVELTQLVMTVWNRFPLDNLLNSLLEDMLTVFCRNPQSSPLAARLVVESLAPLLNSAAISGSSAVDGQVVAAALSLLTCVLGANWPHDVDGYALVESTVYPTLTLLINNQNDLNLLSTGYVVVVVVVKKP